MALPKLNVPVYEAILPSTETVIKYRPFLVKEEKILLMAMEEEDQKHMVNAVRTIVDNCTFKTIKVNKMPMFDLEYVFLNIRAKSVGEVASVKVLCDDDKETYADIDIPLDDIKVKFHKDHTNIIDLTDDIKIEMSYPTFEMIESFTTENTKALFDLMGKCVERIIDGETIHERADFNKKELTDFLDSLNTKQFAEMQKFFETMPKLSHDIEFINPKTKKKHKKTLEGLNSFFA